ncbi:MAG TPA: MBL fold metallo-hydrolase [Phycisphaerae bacterium]|nr:MBL fold metallo-hydrolase [Phycisphaerae bacterium]
MFTTGQTRRAGGLIGLLVLFIGVDVACGQTLRVKEGRQAIVKTQPSGDAAQFPDRLPPGTQVVQIGVVPWYYQIRLADGRDGWSAKSNFEVVTPATPTSTMAVTPESLLARNDVLQIIVIDVEVGDATLIICPEQNGQRDVILIDTGEDDSQRIKDEMARNGIALTGRPITRFVITHYDRDHCGDAEPLMPLAQAVYDHGDNIKAGLKQKYQNMTSQPGVDRRLMTLSYQEDFSGGVSVECVAVNQATDCDPTTEPSAPEEDNPNSIALIVSYLDFDYFTGGDLTKVPERSLANCVRNCDVYHANHHGSEATSSVLEFIQKLDPEVSVASNGTSHGHPNAKVAKRLIEQVGSKFFQTNLNTDTRAHQPADLKFVADDTFREDDEEEDLEGAAGTIRIVVTADEYYVIMPGLDLVEGTFVLEGD